MSGRGRSDGFSLVEMLVALTVFGVFMAGTLSFFGQQDEAFTEGMDRMSVLQNLRFAANALEKDLRTAGSNLAPGQPVLVYGDGRTVAFNADYATNDANDPFAVYYEPEASAAEVRALMASQAGNLPGTSFTYPDTTYWASGPSGAASPAETIIFFFTPDSTTSRQDDFVLRRQVNARPAEVVARNLVPPASGRFLQYWEVSDTASSGSGLQQIPASRLPLRHTAAIHNSAADTIPARRIDEVRGIRLSLTATNGATGSDEKQASLERLVQLPNAGLGRRPSCGDAPILGTSLNASAGTNTSGDPVVDLSWGQATDESGGEQDVVRYVLYRRPSGSSDWGEPMLSIPSGQSSYSYSDATVTGGSSYDYGLAVQDCTPSLSSISSTSGVTAPSPSP